MKDDSQLKPTSAVLDEAHLGDIHGAFGTIRLSDVAPRRTWRRRLLTLAAIIGPGLIVMVGDNDAGGVSTYAQAGQDFGYSLLWTLVLLIPVLIVNQEMVVRLGAVTGVGYARLISERFGRFWGWYSTVGIFLLNFLTISTEFMGISLAGEYFGLSPVLVVPLAALILIGITISGNFRRWERAMFVFLFASLLVLPLALISHPDPGACRRDRRGRDHDGHSVGVHRHVRVRPLPGRASHRARPHLAHLSCCGHYLRPAAVRRLDRRRIGGYSGHLVRVWGPVRRETFASPRRARGEAVLCLIYG